MHKVIVNKRQYSFPCWNNFHSLPNTKKPNIGLSFIEFMNDVDF